VDALANFARLAAEANYSRPRFSDDGVLEIAAGRHPVLERLGEAQRGERFVPNDLYLNSSSDRILIITGPNMGGKSTYLRQAALISILAQMGSFVPAERARLPLFDRIFTRIGASDNLARGRSTFMVEMTEAAVILNTAGPGSLIILDEIGRGTATFDGLAIAWAVVEYLHARGGTKVLFATHYHELTELSLTKQRVKNYNMAVKEWADRIIFLRKVLPGGSSRSYGIQVARLAGIPAEVISRSKEILRNLETGELNEAGMPKLAARDGRSADNGQLSLLVGERDPVHEELKSIDVDRMTPLDALTALHKMKELIKN